MPLIGSAAANPQLAPLGAKELKERCKNAGEPKVREILQAHETEDGRYARLLTAEK